MKKLFSLVLAGLLLALPTSFAWAASLGYGARAIGMGGAYTAVADDGTAPYWNPAGISQIKILTLTPGIGAYGQWDMEKINKLINSMNSTDTPMEIPQIPPTQIGLPLTFGISTRSVALNLMVEGNLDLLDKDKYYKGNLDLTGYATLTGATTFDQLAIGVNVKAIDARTMQGRTATMADPQNLTQAELDALMNSDYNYKILATGNGWSFDLGGLYTIDKQWKVGAVGRNLLSTVNWSGNIYTFVLDPSATASQGKFVFKNTNESYSATSSLPRTYALGASYKPYNSGLLAADVEIITADDADLNQTRLHLGFEQTALWNIFALRLGAFTEKNQPIGMTAGLGLKLGPLMLDLAALKVGESEYGAFLTGGLKF